MKSASKKLKPPVRPDSAPPFQKWCEKDFVADTIHMHWLARMFYARLLQIAFSTSPHRPNIKDSDEAICKLLGNVPLDTWQQHQAEVLEMFQHSEVNGVPVLTQSRLQRDYEVLQDYRFSQSKISKEYWDGVRKERQGSEGATPAQPNPNGKGFGIPSVKGSVSQDDVDFDSDVDVEKDSDGEVEIVPPTRPSSPPFNSNSTSNARNIISPLAHCLAEIHEEICKCPLPEEGWDRVSAIWDAGDYDVSKLLDLWRTFLAWDCLHPEAPLDQFADGLEEELKAAHPKGKKRGTDRVALLSGN